MTMLNLIESDVVGFCGLTLRESAAIDENDPAAANARHITKLLRLKNISILPIRIVRDGGFDTL
jgi:hypothetical protein